MISIDELKKLEKELMYESKDNEGILSDPSAWQSLDVDYHPPRVERVWTQLPDGRRLSLHVIHPCETEEALVHPHPWKSAIHVLEDGGLYEHGIHDSEGNSLVVHEVHGEMYYEMLEEKAEHYVRPITRCVYSIMLTGPVIWPENKTEVNKELKPLTIERKKVILDFFKGAYRRSTGPFR